MAFFGQVALGDTALIPVTTVSSSVPTNADAAPYRHVYLAIGSSLTVLSGGAGQSSQAHTFTVTDATNANPIVITTSAAHGLQDGARVTITGVTGNTNANTSAIINVTAATTFELTGVAGNGAYAGGGTGNVSGFYVHSLACTEGNNFVSGNMYLVLSTWAISSSARHEWTTLLVY